MPKISNRILTLTTNTGHFTLLVDVLTNFVVTAFIGLFNIPIGGTSYKKNTYCTLRAPDDAQDISQGHAKLLFQYLKTNSRIL